MEIVFLFLLFSFSNPIISWFFRKTIIFILFFDNYMRYSLNWKQRYNWESIQQLGGKNNNKLHPTLPNGLKSPALNLCLHIKVLSFLSLGSSNPF